VRQFISDIITTEEIKKWRPGERILITAQTGTGKSHFVKNNIYDFCSKHNLKCLLLSNRSLLKNQNIAGLGDRTKIVLPMNYQQLENQMLMGKNIYQIYAGFDIVVMDEIHYVFNDAMFSRNTDLLLEPLKKPLKDKIFIFITATPVALLDYQSEYEYVYTIPTDYSYIKNLFFYNGPNIPESIFQKLNKTDKVIYFSSNASESFELSEKFENAAFICSESNKLHSKSNKEAREQIEDESKFYKKYLCTTKVLDNGINIIDKDLRHVIIDMLDPVSFIQCLGRKRIVDQNDYINLYVKNYHGGTINYNLRFTKLKLGTVDEFEELGSELFQEEYRKKEFDSIIDNDFKINEAKRHCYKIQIDYLETMLQDEDKLGYKKYICNLLDFDINKTRNADMEYEMMGIVELMENMSNRKLYADEQERLKEIFFGNIFSPKNTNLRNRGLKSINAILEEDNIPYRVTSSKERKGDNRNKHYWSIIRLDELGE
jgi:hypothetical protein